MCKVKLIMDANNLDVCKRITEFFRDQDIEFEVVLSDTATKSDGGTTGGPTKDKDEPVVEPIKKNDTENKGAEVLVSYKTRLNKKLDERIANIFITVGIPANIKGYQFLREAVKLTVERPELINSITKQLYPKVAEKFLTSSSKVERAIRHAIEVGWNRGRADHINNIFGVRAFDTRDKPTNGEFIAIIADKMILEGA